MNPGFDEVARIAHAAPDRLAVVAGDRRLTYAELDRRANQVGHALVVKCTPVGAVIGWHAPVSLELVEVALGAARVDVFVEVIEPTVTGTALPEAYAPLTGLVVASHLVPAVTEAAHANDALNWFLVLDGRGDAGPIDALPNAAPYEPAISAYPGDAVQAQGPRLLPAPGESTGPPALVEPPAELLVDAAFFRQEAWLMALLDGLAVGGRMVVRPGPTDRRPPTTE